MSPPATAPPISPEREQGDAKSHALGASNPPVSVVELPDELLASPAESSPTAEERWLPLPGEVGSEIEALARTALGDLVPPEPALDFNLLDDDETPLLDEPRPLGSAGPPLPNGRGSSIPNDDKEQGTKTAAEAVARVDLPKPGHLEVACPTCSTTGLVPWDRLGGPLCCSGCWTWFRAGENGQLTVVDPPTASQGALRLYSRNGPDEGARLQPERLEEKRRAAQRQRRQGRIAARIGAMVLAVVPIVFVGAMLYLGMRWWSKPRLAKLPQELDRRAQLFVESWLKRDTPTMVRMAHPHYRGPTRRWAHDHRTPLSQGQFDRRKAAISVNILRQDENTADAEVRVDLAGSPEPIVLRQHWESLDGGWFFKPANDSVVQMPKMAAPQPAKKRALSK